MADEVDSRRLLAVDSDTIALTLGSVPAERPLSGLIPAILPSKQKKQPIGYRSG
jgi:hypothetical protein